MPVRIASVVALVILGWALARDIGQAVGPILFRRLDPGTAGTVGFLVRLFTVMLAVLVALRIAGLKPGPRSPSVARSRPLFSVWPRSRRSGT